jgi:hypothetical protein
MSTISIVVLVLGLLIVIVLIALALYKTGFTVKSLKVKVGPVEAEASRDKPAPDEALDSPGGARITQRAQEGGEITQSGITAPADSEAQIEQQAKGTKSKIDDSPIKLT